MPPASLKGLQNWINQTCFFYQYLETNGNPATVCSQLNFTYLEIPVLFSVAEKAEPLASWLSVVISTFPGEGFPSHWGLIDLVPLFIGIFCNPERPDLDVKEWKNIDLGFHVELFCIPLSSLGPKSWRLNKSYIRPYDLCLIRIVFFFLYRVYKWFIRWKYREWN